MPFHIALGTGAGLVSALLFAAAGTGSVPAVLLMYLAPLPMLIVALGWHHLVGLLALAVGGLATTFLMRPSAGLAFALGPAAAAWILAYVALLRRPVPPEGDSDATATPGWCSPGQLLLAVGILAATIAFVSLTAATGGDHERYREALERAVAGLIQRETRGGRPGSLPSSFGVDGAEFVRLVVAITPALLASMLGIILAANLWLAGRVVAISGRLARPRPDTPSARMPMAGISAAGAALVAAQFPGFPGVAGTALVGGLAMAFALQGLALVHWASRGRPGRGFALSVLYVLTIVLGYLFLPAFALIGMADTAFPLRRFIAARGSPPSPPSSF